MGRSYDIYILPLPSGKAVRVRKPGATGLLAHGAISFSLFQLAIEAAGQAKDEDEPVRQRGDPLGPVHAICRATLVDEMDPSLLPWVDRLAVAHWASVPDVIEPATCTGKIGYWKEQDFAPLVRGKIASLVDMICHRYSILPSRFLDVNDAPFAHDLDLAIAYRGLRREADAGSGDGEVEVEDGWGNVHRVPASALVTSDIPSDAKVMHADSLAQRYGPVALSAGGNQDGSLTTLGVQ